jgi:ribonuclease Z
MQNFELTILGCSSATPTSNRNPTSQLLNIAERYFLIDCGEATQIQLRKFHIKFSRINNIFISHLHGDHYFGLVGLLSSFHLLGRTVDLHLYCTEELKEIIEMQHRLSYTVLNYKIIYHYHKYLNNDLIFEDDKVEVRTIVLNHRIPCCGFVFIEKPLIPSISKEAIQKYNLKVSDIVAIKRGEDYITSAGEVIHNSNLVNETKQPRKFVYCSDTNYNEKMIEFISHADLLYHEATFLHNMLDRAKETFHTTALQAGIIAKKSHAKKLVIGHYSARYKDLQPLLIEAKTEFENTILAIEGETISVPYS